MSSTKPLRLRIFAGPNGSGKSTLIESIRRFKVYGRTIDLGFYINADDIARDLRVNGFDFDKYEIKTDVSEFKEKTIGSGLVKSYFEDSVFLNAFTINKNRMILKDSHIVDRLSQIVSEFLRNEMLYKKRRFSIETVFSHESKLELMKQAKEAGYKVYLYYVSTEDPQINIYRVKVRVQSGGHDVSEEKIIQRYYKSLNLLYDAAQLSYQCYFFNNSDSGEEPNATYFAKFKVVDKKKEWEIDEKNVPNWFYQYYSDKIKK